MLRLHCAGASIARWGDTVLVPKIFFEDDFVDTLGKVHKN